MDNNFGKRIAWLLRSIAALLGAVALYAAFMWPSHRHLGDGIPYTSYNAEVAEARTLVPGDPLQLLYHFQLVRGMFSGRVPPFTNLYEFNLGDDDGRRAFDPYYVPFSLLFAATSPALGDAAAWNLSLFTAVLLGFLLLLALARRFQGDEASEALAFAAAFIATCVPYRWVTLAGGSPTGFGIALIPAVALGVDIAVRDGRVRGGALAGAMLVLCYATDLHSFLFATLALPLWCLVSWASSTETLLPGLLDASSPSSRRFCRSPQGWSSPGASRCGCVRSTPSRTPAAAAPSARSKSTRQSGRRSSITATPATWPSTSTSATSCPWC